MLRLRLLASSCTAVTISIVVFFILVVVVIEPRAS